MKLELSIREWEDLKKNPNIDSEEYDYTGRRFWVVEDNEINREIATELLRQHGAAVGTAGNGEEALI